MTELLAPAGSLEALRVAVNAGADAVYIGGRAFGARAYAENPDESGLIEGIEYCHLRGKKIYLTVNTLLKERELRKHLISFLEPLYVHGIDALIIQDVGVLRFLRAYYPDLELHASTQMSVTTPEGALWLKTLGISRVVPARELSLNEVRSIVQSGMEVETFVHGAMCYCYSGRCLFSSMLGGRSGNRGRCAQPCRLPYSLEADDTFYDKHVPSSGLASDDLNARKRGHVFAEHRTGKSSSDPACLLSLKDMCTLDILPDLIDAGIASFKIEGRMKPPQYSAGVTSVYRKYMDLYASVGRAGYRVLEEDRRILSDLFDRGGFSKGYYQVNNGPDMLARKHQDAGDVRLAQQKNERNQQFLCGNSKIKINGDLRIYPDTPVILDVWLSGQEQNGDYSVHVISDVPQKAKTNPATVEEVSRQIRKTGNTPFVFDDLHIDLADGLFLPVRVLNDLRREALQRLNENTLMQRHPRPAKCYPEGSRTEQDTRIEKDISTGRNGVYLKDGRRADDRRPRLNLLITSYDQFDAILRWLAMNAHSDMLEQMDTIYLDSMLLGAKRQLDHNCLILKDKIDALQSGRLRCMFVFPPILRESGQRILEHPAVKKLLEQMDGFLVQTVDELAVLKNSFAEQKGKTLVSDDCLYAFNSEARELLHEAGVSRFTLPAELNAGELSHLDLTGCELIIYGRQPLMQSAQCIRKNTSGCDPNAAGTSCLRDRKQMRFPVLTRCLFCTNTIYNSIPLDLTGCMDEIETLSPSFLRIAFTVETANETIQILDDYLKQSRICIRETGTRGHFKRGVE